MRDHESGNGQEHPSSSGEAPGRAPGKRTLTAAMSGPGAVQRTIRGAPTDHPPAARGNEQVQRQILDDALRPDLAPDIQGAAAHGISGAGGPLPHLDTVQRLFGHHDVSGIEAHQDAAAREGSSQMGAAAFATGNHVAFADGPDLHTTAHEAAHVVQQRGGVALLGGVGQVGDVYERHADDVADRVVRGESAETLLDELAGRPAAAAEPGGAVQHLITGSTKIDQVAMLQAGFNLFLKGAVPAHKGLKAAHDHEDFAIYVTAAELPEGKAGNTEYAIMDAENTYVECGPNLGKAYEQIKDRPTKIFATVTLSTRAGAFTDYTNVAQVLAHEVGGHALSLGPYVQRMLDKDADLVESWNQLATQGPLSENAQHAAIGYQINEAYPAAVAAMCALLKKAGLASAVAKLNENYGNDVYGQIRDHGPDKGTAKARQSALLGSDAAQKDIAARMG